MSFGATLRTLRMRRRPYLSQARLGEAAGYDHSFLSRLEMDMRAPSRGTIHAIANALGATPEERDQLLASAGFLPVADADPLIVELLSALTNPLIPVAKRAALRELVQMQTRWTVAWEAAGADRPDFDAAAFDREVAAGLAAAR